MYDEKFSMLFYGYVKTEDFTPDITVMDYNFYKNTRSSSFSSDNSLSTCNSVFSNSSCSSSNIQQITELNNYYNSNVTPNKGNQIYNYYNNKEITHEYNQLTKENLLLNEYQKQIQSIQVFDTNSSNGNSMKQNNQIKEQNKKLFKTELCTKYVLTNECPYNEKCQFAHGLKELQSRHVNSRFKSKMCKNYNKTGYCRYGDRCQFKHGENSNSNRHLYVKEKNGKDLLSVSSSVVIPNNEWVANVKYIDKINNW